MSKLWVRHWIGMFSDPKWKLIAHQSRQRVGDVIALFDYLMEVAGDAEDPGSIARWDPDIVAVVLGLETAEIASIFEAMRGRVHDGERLTGWDRRQPLREREDDDSAGRTRRWRARNNPVTPCDATRVESESEQTQKEDHTGRARAGLSNLRVPDADDVAALEALLRSAADASLAKNAPGLSDLSPIIGLSAPGAGLPCDLHQHILPAIRARARTVPAGRVHTWNYYVNAIIDYRDRCLAGAPEPQPSSNVEIFHGRTHDRRANARADRRAGIAAAVARERAEAGG